MKKNLLTVFFVLVVAFCVYAEYEGTYVTGDTFFSGKLGFCFPALEYYPNEESSSSTVVGFGFDEGTTGLSLGGMATLSYQIMLDQKTSLGAEVGYSFFQQRDEDILTLIPITAKLSLFPVQKEKFNFQINFSAGAAILKGSKPHICPCASASLNPVYFLSDTWSIGLDAGIISIAEIYFTSDQARKNNTCFAFMVPVTASVTYRQ